MTDTTPRQAQAERPLCPHTLEVASRAVERMAYFSPKEIEGLSDVMRVAERATIRESKDTHRIAAAIRALAAQEPHT